MNEANLFSFEGYLNINRYIIPMTKRLLLEVSMLFLIPTVGIIEVSNLRFVGTNPL